MLKIFHIGDLHFGKVVHNVQMVNEDQPFWVEGFLKAVDEQKPDAVIIAGDVYDQKLPSESAVKLLNYFFQELAKRDIYVFIVPGNHDSAIRLSFASELLENNKIYIAGEVQKDLFYKNIVKDGKEYVFWLMPYIYPKLVGSKQVLNREDIVTFDMAARALLENQEINKDKCNILVAHQNVLANGKRPEHSDSESIIGNLGEIDYRVFDDFDYVALGHIHNMQSMGRETVRYSGCPMYYDFSEVNRKKAVTVIEADGKDISISELEVPLMHKMVQMTGTMSELTEKAKTMPDKDKFYIKAVMTDAAFSVDMENLRTMKQAFGPTLINIVHEPAGGSISFMQDENSDVKPEVAMNDFYGNLNALLQSVSDIVLTEKDKMIIDMILEQQEANGLTAAIDFGKINNKSPEFVELAENILAGR